MKYDQTNGTNEGGSGLRMKRENRAMVEREAIFGVEMTIQCHIPKIASMINEEWACDSTLAT